MKSIANQYRDLREGRMSQANFMRNLRMMMPQHITNVTSFGDAVRILKNKAILTENIEPLEPSEEEKDDAEMQAMIDKIEQEEENKPEYLKIRDFPGGLGESMTDFPRDAKDMAKFIAGEYGSELKQLPSREREKMAFSHAYKTILNSGHPEAKVIAKNIVRGYADEDWPMDFISTLNNILGRDNLNEGKGKELHPNQIHPQELRMGIKVELEHTDDLDKAKKIALDHLAENPFYYTALKLAGVESPSAPKVKVPKEAAKKAKKKDATEFVDKDNAMKPVKGIEKIKASANKAHKETNKMVKGVEELTHTAKKAKGIKQVMSPTGGKMKTIKENFDPERMAKIVDSLRTNYNMNNNEIHSTLVTKYGLSDMEANKIINPIPLTRGVNLGSSFDKFKSQLEEIVREVVNEYYFDGRDNLTDPINYQLNEDEGFEQWKQALYNIVMEKADLEASEIAIDDEEIEQYYQQGKTPEEVYFDIWQQDAGNFYNVPF